MGEFEGQDASEALKQWGFARRGQGGGRARSPAPGGQADLEDEGLREGQRPARPLVVLVRFRLVQAAQRLGVGVDALAPSHVDWHRVGNVRVVQVFEDHADGAGDRPRCQRASRRVDRDGAGGDAFDVFPVDALK